MQNQTSFHTTYLRLEITIARGVLPFNFYDIKIFSIRLDKHWKCMYYVFEILAINITIDYAVIDIV